jgi:hypothetical protein
MPQPTDNLEIGLFYSLDYLTHSSNIDSPAINRAYKLAFDKLKTAQDLDVINNGGSDTSQVFEIVPVVDPTEVLLQDPTNPLAIVCFNHVEGTTTLTTQANIDDRIINVTDSTGITAGTYVGIFNLETDRFYEGFVVSVNVNALTMDTPIHAVFEIGDLVGFGTNNMNVDGSVTPIIFGLRGADPGIDVTVDVTRIIFSCLTLDPADLSKFGDIDGGLLNGIVIRQRNGRYNSILTAKTNGQMANLMYDFQIYASLNPAQGQDGFVARMTFSGQSKMGAVVRVGPGEELEMIIQDDLTQLISFTAVIEGHIVVD